MDSAVATSQEKVQTRFRPDFFALLQEQASLLAEMVRVLQKFMSSHDRGLVQSMLTLEQKKDFLKSRNLDTLNRTFSTPLERDELYWAITTLNRAMREIAFTIHFEDELGIEADASSLEFTRLLREIADSLERGYTNLKDDPLLSREAAYMASNCQDKAEMLYYQSLRHLYDVTQPTQLVGTDSGPMKADAMRLVLATFKRSEIYYYLNNIAKEMVSAANHLQGLVVEMI